jgi:hypothetical protein
MRSRIIICIATIFCIFIHWPQLSFAQVSVSDSTFQGIQLRNIGPAFMSGRIADIAIHPENDNLWYVAVGSGGVWKTVNAGVTWKPIFDDQSVYSIGCVSLDPNNPNIVWVGTGRTLVGDMLAMETVFIKVKMVVIPGKTWA